MPAAIAASFKATAKPNPNDTKNPGNNKKNWNGIRTDKTKLVKQQVPISMTVTGIPND
jgi:hypothetical protein